MTAKEKAKDLYNKYEDSISGVEASDWFESAKKCALVAVDEITKTLKDNDLYIGGETNIDEIIRFWQEVKQEIENL